MPQAIYKVPNGKLLKVFLELQENTIDSISITGDFFVYPEEKIEELEQVLVGQELTQEALQQCIQTFVDTENIELFGIDVESLVTTLLMCNPEHV